MGRSRQKVGIAFLRKIEATVTAISVAQAEKLGSGSYLRDRGTSWEVFRHELLMAVLPALWAHRLVGTGLVLGWYQGVYRNETLMVVLPALGVLLPLRRDELTPGRNQGRTDTLPYLVSDRYAAVLTETVKM